jgi:Fe-S cluster biogenesis protein NfuA
MAERLTSREVERRLALLDDLLGRLEQIPGATAAIGLDAARALAEVYGEAVARLMDRLADVPAARDAATADELIGHLLVLHGIHPAGVADRIAQALDGVRRHLHGGQLRLVGVADGIARIELAGPGCSSPGGALELAVREAVLAAAPELRDVQPVRAPSERAPALIPLSEVRRRPRMPAAGGPA